MKSPFLIVIDISDKENFFLDGYEKFNPDKLILLLNFLEMLGFLFFKLLCLLVFKFKLNSLDKRFTVGCLYLTCCKAVKILIAAGTILNEAIANIPKY